MKLSLHYIIETQKAEVFRPQLSTLIPYMQPTPQYLINHNKENQTCLTEAIFRILTSVAYGCII